MRSRKYRFWLYHADMKVPQLIQYDPVGWDELAKAVTRSREWHGVTYKYSPRLRWVKDGKQLVLYYYERYGIDANITVYIDKYVNNEWRRDYEGILQLKTLSITTLYAECNVEQTGFTQKIVNRADVAVNVSEAGVQTVTLHARELTKAYVKKTDVPVGDIATLAGVTFVAGNNYIIVDLDQFTQDEIGKRENYGLQVSALNPVDYQKYIFKLEEDGAYTFNARCIFYAQNSATVSWTVKWWIVTGRPGAYTYTQIGTTIVNSSTFVEGAPALGIGGITLNLKKDDEVYFFGEFNVSAGNNTFGFQPYNYTWGGTPQISFSVSGVTTFKSTTATGVAVYETWNRLVQGITGKINAFYSDLYNRTDLGAASEVPEALKLITNGSRVRTLSKAVNVTLNDLYTSLTAIDGIGMGIEKVNGVERVRVEHLSYFYKNVEIIKLSFVKDIARDVADEYYFNQLEIGYDKWNNERSNNLDEFNSKREFLLPIENNSKKLVLKSSMIAAGYTIETVRRDINDLTKDNDRDNDLFVIQLRRNAGDLVPEKTEGLSASNVLNSYSLYNLRLSPMRCLLRNGARVRSGLWKKDSSTITMTRGEGNTAMISTGDVSYLLSESSITVNQLAAPIWIPEIISFKAPINDALMDAIEAEPLGYISFSRGSTNYQRGFILDVNPEAKAKGRLAEFRLLRAY